MSAAPPTPPSRSGNGDPSIRRTWWLLAVAFFALALINGIRLVVDKQPADWITIALIVVAAVAAIAHRNAVGGLEARGRGEAEGFARIIRGLSHSVSADAIVSAILEDLIDATAADHVVLVRRRQDGLALDATLVSRRSGVPTTTTVLPLSVLDLPPGEDRAPVPVAMANPAPAFGAPADGAPAAGAPADSGVPISDAAPSIDAESGDDAVASTATEPAVEPAVVGESRLPSLPTVARRASDPGGGGPSSDGSPPKGSRCSRTSGCRHRTSSAPEAMRRSRRCLPAVTRRASRIGSRIAFAQCSGFRTRSRRRCGVRTP